MRITFKSYDELLPLTKLKASKHQRNKHPEDQIIRLAKIMEKHGVRQPIHISNRSGDICFGHGRLEAAKLNNYKKYPVVYQDFETDEEEYACVQSDNAIAGWAELDLSGINSDIPGLGPDFDLDMLGIKDFVLEPAEMIPQADEDEVPEHVEPRTKLGDVYTLGRQRLVCGDSTSVDTVDSLMNGEKADMVFTDPPYNYTPANRGAGALGAQASKVGKKIEFISQFNPDEFLSILLTLSEPPFSAYIFCNTELVLNYLTWADANDFNYNILTWHKTRFIPANSNHHYPDTEYCIFISKKPIFKSGLSADHYRKYWIENKDGNDLHPTMKPVSIIEKCVELNSNKSVLDLFGGSGSTLIACEKTNRKCYMMELDPHYCDVIVKRWENYTGKKAELTNGKTNIKVRRSADRKDGVMGLQDR